eukprot:XP_001705228.1 Hypothetical protein GL50803_95449 [Giardia lamblia ATCC 50803]
MEPPARALLHGPLPISEKEEPDQNPSNGASDNHQDGYGYPRYGSSGHHLTGALCGQADYRDGILVCSIRQRKSAILASGNTDDSIHGCGVGTRAARATGIAREGKRREVLIFAAFARTW